MVKARRVFIYVICVTILFVQMDWQPIHQSYLKYNDWPHESVNEWWPMWSGIRYWSATVLCPPCAALAEHGYFVLFELQAGIEERNDLLLKHIPPPYKYEGVLSPNGFWFGQGGEDNSNEWKHVSLLAFWLYWMTVTVFWWWLWASDVFDGRWPWWMSTAWRLRHG